MIALFFETVDTDVTRRYLVITRYPSGAVSRHVIVPVWAVLGVPEALDDECRLAPQEGTMKEKGMGRTRLGRLAAVTVPATALSLGFGFAIAQGMVSASLSAADPFQVKADSAAASGLELSLRAADTATSNTDGATTQKKAALVTLTDASVTNLCLAANQPTGLPGLLGNIGLVVSATGNVPLGSAVDLNADAVTTTGANLGQTEIGLAQSGLDHQSGIASGYNVGGFGLESTEALSLDGLDANAYALTLDSLNLASGLSIVPQLGEATC